MNITMNKWLQGFIATLFSGLACCALAAAAQSPSGTIRQMTEGLIEVMKARKSELATHPEHLYAVVDQKAVPFFDFVGITRSAMGRYWRDANAQQQAALVQEFQQMLIRTYASALLKYTGQTVEYLAERQDDKPGFATVNTKIIDPTGPAIPVDYRLRQSENNNWLVYDVFIDGISLIANYRSTFASKITQNGIQGLIEELRRFNAKATG